MFKELLNKIEECENTINYEEHRDKYLDKLVHSYPTLTADVERELFEQYNKTNDRTYKDIIFKCNLKVVHDTCTDTTSYREDLISEGIVFLCEFIDQFDYTMPNITFNQVLKDKLTVFYNSKRIENNKQLNTDMSIEELKEQEEEGKCLTETEEIKPVMHKRYREQLIIEIPEGINIVPWDELTITPKEELIIVPKINNYLLDRRAKKELFDKIFSDDSSVKKANKRLVLHLRQKYKPTDMEY